MALGLRMPDYRALAMRGVLSLPTPILRAISGGGVIYRAGRTLDPRFQFLGQFLGEPASGQAPETVRHAFSQALALVRSRPDPEIRRQAVTVNGPAGPIPCRLYTPTFQDSASPVIVYAHCGGGIVGDLETCEGFCQVLARTAETPVLSVDYRLAPEHRFPAGLEDVLAVFRHAREAAESYGAAPGLAAIAGDGAGGNFAAVIPQLLKAAGEAQPVCQLLIYPSVDLVGQTPSQAVFADAFPPNRTIMSSSHGQYVGAEADPADPRLSPIRAADLSGLCPAVVVAAGFDPLADQVKAYAEALRSAGVAVAYRCYDPLPHAFIAYVGAAPAAQAACREIATLMRDVIRSA